MKYALFLGCNIPARVQHYDISSRSVLNQLNVDLVDVPQFKCCGYPMRNTDFKTFILFSARNLALAEKLNLPILTLCKCCFGSLKKANHLLKEDPDLKTDINTYLKKENLSYAGHVEVNHLLSLLHKDIGLDILKSNITRAFKGVNIAVHYGCHALRPSDIMQFDDPIAPVLFDELVGITGAKSVDWPLQLECCGAPLLGVNDDLSMDLTAKKLADGKQAGADYVCTACPWCQLQFDSVQSIMADNKLNGNKLPAIVYSQLLGLAMGIDPDTLGLEMNRMDIGNITSSLTET